ncbi:MAG TPA: hypothetical protein VMQ44_01615 [Candidatus Saccharimonadales bacterium]|nr:hypothetical protein [Candidatus Saccharimonadales bacterium]
MKCIGPKAWCSFIEHKAGAYAKGLTVVCLNPDRLFRKHLVELETAVRNHERIILFSLTSEDELRSDPRISNLLDSVEHFIHGPRETVIGHLCPRPKS